jgi:hypothetical protein
MNLNLSRQTGHIKLTELALWQPTFPQLCREFYAPKIDANKLNAGYFLRCAGTRRGNSTVSDTASLLMLDGDSRLVDGEIVAGAVNPLHVHMMLNHLNLDHFIYTSHSNDVDLHKYRVLIPVEYTRQQLPALLDWIFGQLHENEITLANVKENAAWSQAWFMPCVPAERAHLFQTWWRVGGKVSNPRAITNSLEPVEPFDVVRICADYENKQSIANESITHTPLVARSLSADPIKSFNESFTAEEILIRNGYTKVGKRYLHPNSSSKIAGVRILDNGRVYSDSSDVLNDGKAHDSWDCYRLLECGGDMRQALNWNAELTKENQRAFYAN